MEGRGAQVEEVAVRRVEYAWERWRRACDVCWWRGRWVVEWTWPVDAAAGSRVPSYIKQLNSLSVVAVL